MIDRLVYLVYLLFILMDLVVKMILHSDQHSLLNIAEADVKNRLYLFKILTSKNFNF